MRPQLERVYQGETFGIGVSIRLDWSNDRHHEVVIMGVGNADDVVSALLRLAQLVGNDPHLRLGKEDA